jgi:hypothetical protein
MTPAELRAVLGFPQDHQTSAIDHTLSRALAEMPVSETMILQWSPVRRRRNGPIDQYEFEIVGAGQDIRTLTITGMPPIVAKEDAFRFKKIVARQASRLERNLARSANPQAYLDAFLAGYQLGETFHLGMYREHLRFTVETLDVVWPHRLPRERLDLLDRPAGSSRLTTATQMEAVMRGEDPNAI